MSGHDDRRERSLSSGDRASRRRARDSDDDAGDLRSSRYDSERRSRYSGRRRDRSASQDETSSHNRRRRRSQARDDPRVRDEDERRSTKVRRHRRDRSRSPDDSRHRNRSLSPPPKRRMRPSPASPSPPRRSRGPLPSQDESFRGDRQLAPGEAPPPEKQKPNFKPTGLLAKEANTVAGTSTVLKYHEPPEARKPPAKESWRLFVFKGKDLIDTIHIHQRSVWLCGRDPKVTDLLLEHPSISKQHAVIQFRHRETRNEFGDKLSKVKPYLIDLDSANGTTLNGEKVKPSRYVELMDADIIKFGDSEREYVVMLPPA